jgi:hypothetical protein
MNERSYPKPIRLPEAACLLEMMKLDLKDEASSKDEGRRLESHMTGRPMYSE